MTLPGAVPSRQWQRSSGTPLSVKSKAAQISSIEPEQTNPNGPPIISATQGLQVDYPASSAYVTGMGGSEFKPISHG
jgi:hypothetical protein